MAANVRCATDPLPRSGIQLTSSGVVSGAQAQGKMSDLSEMPYSSVQQREYFVSAHMRAKNTMGNFPSTPDLVQSLNQLNDSHLPAIAGASDYGQEEAKRRSTRCTVHAT